MNERTLVICKPDAVMKGISNQIILRFREAGLEVTHFDKIKMGHQTASQLYQEHQGRPYFEGLILAMISGDCIILTVEGHDAIQRVRTINGPTRDAPEGTIRGDFPSAGGPFNIVHGSDSPNSAAREIKIFFPDL